MRNTLLWCVGSILVTSMMVLGIVFITVEGQTPTGNSASAPIPQEEDCQYILGSYQGRVAVFLKGEEKPQMILDVYVKQLPPYDQGQLGQGIPVPDYQTLVTKIEDYIS